ncbi:hypothetical protein Tco_1292999 [Tanacetum coccineum]
MSDSDESTVTYTEVSSPFEGLSDIGSPGVVGPEHEGLSWMLDDSYVQVALQAPPSPDYIPGPEEPQSPPLPDFVPEPVYPEYMLQKDEVFPAKEQSLPAAASPTAHSPDYVLESDPEEDPEEDDDEDPEEDPVDYPAEGGDDGDDEDEPSDYDKDEEAPSAEETEPFETDEFAATPPPHPAYRVTARISIPAPVPTPVWFDSEVARLLAISTPPSSPLSPWSSPLPQIPSPPLPPILSPLPVSPPLPQIPSPPLPVSSPIPMLSPSPPASPIRLLAYRAAMIRLRAEAASTSHSLPLPPPIILFHPIPDAPSSGTPPLHLLSTDRRKDIPEVTLPLKRGLRMTVVWDLGLQDTYEVYTRLDDEQTGRQLLVGRLNILFKDRRAHARAARLMETKARIELQSADHRRQTVITEMLAADHRRQEQLTKALKLVKRLQTQMAELQRQQGPANGPAQPDAPEEAGSSS